MNIKHSTKIITKLNRDTQENKIKWEAARVKPYSISGNEAICDHVYTCKVLDKFIRLYKFQAKDYYDEGLYEWTDGYRLEFVDYLGNSEWTFPVDRAIYDLYETVRYKTTDVEGFVEKFLNEDEKKSNDDEPSNFY